MTEESRYQIEIVAEGELPASLREAALKAAHTTLNFKSIEAAALTIFLTDDEALRRLNQRYFDVNKPTDVLSFPAGEPMPGWEQLTEAPYLGDVAISIPTAQKQAAAAGHELVQECQLLTIHAILHLLGYDHVAAAQKREMWRVQSEIMRQLNLGELRLHE